MLYNFEDVLAQKRVLIIIVIIDILNGRCFDGRGNYKLIIWIERSDTVDPKSAI